MNRLSIGVVLLLFLSACNTGTSDWISEVPVVCDDISKEIVWLDIPTDSLNAPIAFAKTDDKIIVADVTQNTALKIFDCSDKTLTRCLNIGRSEVEVIDVHQMFLYKDYLVVVDNLSKKMLFLDLEDYTIKKVYDINNYSTVAIVNDSIVGTLLSSKARYGKTKLDNIHDLRGFMDYSEYGLSNSLGSGLLQGHVVADDDSHLAWFGYYSAIYQVIDYDKETVIKSKILNESSFNNHDQYYATLRPDSIISFISVDGNNDHICVLYDGKELLHYMNNRGQKPYGNSILRLDWNGNMLSRYDSSLPIKCLHIDSSRLYLCVLIEDGNYKIGYYNLK